MKLHDPEFTFSSFGRIITDSAKMDLINISPTDSNVRCLELTCALVISYQDFSGLLQSFVGNGRRLVREPSGIQCCAMKCSPPIGQSYDVLLTCSGASCRASCTLRLPLIRKVSGTAIDGGNFDFRMKS